MKRIKHLLMIVMTVVLTLSLTGCAVPYTYITIATDYIKEHKEAFSDQIDAFYETLDYSIPDNLKGTALEKLLYEMTGADTYASAKAEQEKEQKTEKQSSGSKKKKSSSKKEETPAETPEPSSREQEEPLDSSDSSEIEEASSERSESAASGSAYKAINSAYVPDYVHYEIEDYETLCKEFKEAGEKDDSKEIEDLYHSLVDDLMRISTMSTVAFLNFSVDVNDTYYDEEYTYCEKLYTDCYDLFMLACQDVLDSDGSDHFIDIANADIVEEAREYEALTQNAKDLLDKETRLENEYNQKLDKMGELTYELNGKTYSFDQIYEDDSELSMLALFHYNDFIKVYEGLLKAANDSLGPIYLELLQIRGQLADEFGYDSYADYCYENIYGREYTTEDAAAYCEVIKDNISSAYYQDAYYRLYNSTYFETEIALNSRLEHLNQFASYFSPITEEAFEVFTEKELYDMGSGEGRYAGSYTTSIYSEHVPFIFANVDDDISGLSTLDHEFGHFANDVYEETRDPDYFFCNGNYDVFEIHSNAFQLMCSNHYRDFLPEGEAEDALDYELAVQLDSVVEGCIYDEFQRKAYEMTDATLDEINEIYAETCRSYGQIEIPGFEYMWVIINHNFESPMYYISYSISALSALEIWSISIDNEKEAIKAWETVVKEEDDESYETVMKNARLTPFTDSKGVIKICNYAMDYINGSFETGGIAA